MKTDGSENALSSHFRGCGRSVTPSGTTASALPGAQPKVNEYAWTPGEKRSSSKACEASVFDARTV